MKVLVIAPHPDDEVLGCGGTMAAHAAAGDHVAVAILTRGDPRFFSPGLIARTREEMDAAHRLLGVSEQVFSDFPAPGLDMIGTHIVADRLRDIVQSVRPQIVYVPYGGDLHLDHKTAYIASLVATRPASNSSVQRVLCYETPSETEWGDVLMQSPFIPTVFHDISDYLATKLGAMECYRTQLRPAPHPRNIELIRMLASVRGSSCGLHAAEAFALVRETKTWSEREFR